MTFRRRCSGCRRARYCGGACQRQAWKLQHKRSCGQPWPTPAGLPRATLPEVVDILREFGRADADLADAVAETLGTTTDDRDTARFGPFFAGDAAREKKKRLETLRAAARRAFSPRGAEALATLATRNQLSVVVPSAFGRKGEAAYDGVGLFPLTCLMNHDCRPNAEVRFDDENAAGDGDGADDDDEDEDDDDEGDVE